MSGMLEARCISLQGQEISYWLRRSARCRGVNLRVDERGLVVSAPERISERRLHGVLHDAAQWVVTKLAHWQEWQARRPAPPQLRDGVVLEFLGAPLPLALRAGRYGAARDMFSLLVSVPRPDDEARVRKQVSAWYRDEALRHFPTRIAHYAEQLAVRAGKLTVSEAKTRWGSCNARGEIRLSWRLMQAPPRLVDYVVAHELAHLRELNHSPRFWELVAGVYPQYRDARKELDSLTQRYMAL